MSAFSRFIINNNCETLLNSWEKRIKITSNDLNYKPNKLMTVIPVDHKPDLAKKYLRKFVSCSELSEHISLFGDPEITIIEKSKSVILTHNGVPVGAVIRDAALKNVSDHFGAKMKVTIEAHPDLKRGQAHSDRGKLTGYGYRKEPLNSTYGSYAYKDKALHPEIQKIFDEDGNTLAKWLYENGKHYLPFTTVSYEEFKAKVKLGDDEVIGAIFCALNYEAVGHRDNDRSEWAIGYVFEEGIVHDGYFFYPEYGIAIEMTTNSIWCWLTQAVHGTANLDLSKGGSRYTAALTLTEKTARAIEKTRALEQNN